MRTTWNDEEDDALQGLPLRAQIMYLRGIRRYMDYASGICGGPNRRISLAMLAEITQELVNRQILPKVSKDGVRASLDQLKRAGLIERLADADYLMFFLPKADREKSAQNNNPATARQPRPGRQSQRQAVTEQACRGDLHPSAPQRVLADSPTHQLSVDQDNTALPDGRAAKPAASPPYQAIVNLYHESLPQLPKVYKLNDGRRRRIKALWEEELESLNSWGNYFRHIAGSDFLMGRSRGRDGAPFLASFDFIIHPAKFIKIAEEQYHDKKVPKPRH